MGFTDYLTILILVAGAAFYGIGLLSKKGRAAKSSKTGSAEQGDQTAQDIASEYLARAGTEDRASEIPAWSLQLRSPYKPAETAPTSWIGGVPSAPVGFKWPYDTLGKRQHFLAQIDLSALSRTPNNALPSQGALLVFFSINWDDQGRAVNSYSCQILPAAQMAYAVEQEVPADLSSLQTAHFWRDAPTFRKTPVDVVPFLDDGSNPPKQLPDPFETAENWISNWGLAAVEAENALKHLTNEWERWHSPQGQEQLESERKLSVQHPNIASFARKVVHIEAILKDGGHVIQALETWRDMATSRPVDAPVDRRALQQMFDLRAGFAEDLVAPLQDTMRKGDPKQMWDAICLTQPAFKRGENYEAIPPHYRDFIGNWVTRWSGHRIFGLEPPFPNNSEDFRGQDCFISIAFDDVLGNRTEHDYGLSIWCPRDEMAAGKFDNGQLVRHCAV